MAPPNLFVRLHKWAARQDENFLTESLAVLLESLLVLAPDVGTRLVARLTGGFIELSPAEAVAINIRTQVEAERGRPDFEVRAPRLLVWIEVKVESELRVGQLAGYRVLLGQSGIEQTRLVLLSRYRETFEPEDTRPDLEVLWFTFADWLESELPAAEAAGEVAGFLARRFLDFLGARKMRLAQVEKYLPEGVRALSNLLDMLFEAAAACKVPAKIAAGRQSSGINLDGVKYWIGVDYTDPEKLWFGTRCRINPEAAAKLPDGIVTEESWVPGGYRWWKSVELSSEPVHFYSRTKVGQFEWLQDFLQECLNQARLIETPDQPPIPEEPEGN